MAVLEARILDSFTDIDRASWDALYGDDVEGYDYLVACERAVPAAFRFHALAVFDGDRLIAGAPVFRVSMSLHHLADGALGAVLKWLHRWIPTRLTLSMLGVGSPYVDEMPWAFAPELSPERQQQALSTAIASLQAFGGTCGADLLLLKNVTRNQNSWMAPVLSAQAFASVYGLPTASLAVPASEAAYIAGLSANMRSNIRRKLKKASGLRVEIRDSAAGVEDQLVALRNETIANAPTDYDVFETIAPGYYQAVMQQVGDKARLLLFWHGERLLGFALALLEQGRLKEKYTGQHYPDGMEHGVFFLSWMSMIRLCIEQGIGEFHAGETTYLTKARLGCTFSPSRMYVQHTNRVINGILRRVVHHFDIDKADPDLIALGDKAPYQRS